MGWVAWAGGDFMVGRFLTPALAVSAAALATVALPRRAALVGVAGALLVAGWSGTLRSPHRGTMDEPAQLIDDDGLIVERLYYTPGCALVGWRRGRSMPQHRFRDRATGQTVGQVIAPTGAGITGYFSDPTVYLMDPTGVTDPFLARLPAKPGSRRPGHLYRAVPPGYRESLIASTCAVRDPAMDRLCDDVRLASRGSLVAPGRAAAIGRLLRGDVVQVLTGRRP